MTQTPLPRHVNEHAEEIVPPTGYRSPAWYEARDRGVSASDIAVILGISPYDSAFNLWWRRHTAEPGDRVKGEAEQRRTSRGSRVEPLVIEDFESEHPEFAVRPCGLVRNVNRHWQLATPDSLVYERYAGTKFYHSWVGAAPIAVLEAKTAGGGEGFGDRGTDQIPLHYRAQVIWQMDVLGLTVAYVPVWVGFDYREYVVEYDAEDAEWMREQAQAFLQSLEDGEPPEIDEHPMTTRRLKQMHPTVIDGSVEIPEPIVNQYLAAKRLEKAAHKRVMLAENRLRALLGDYQRGTVNGAKRVSRSVYDVPERVQTVKPHTVSKVTVSLGKSTLRDTKVLKSPKTR